METCFSLSLEIDRANILLSLSSLCVCLYICLHHHYHHYHLYSSSLFLFSLVFLGRVTEESFRSCSETDVFISLLLLIGKVMIPVNMKDNLWYYKWNFHLPFTFFINLKFMENYHPKLLNGQQFITLMVITSIANYWKWFYHLKG